VILIQYTYGNDVSLYSPCPGCSYTAMSRISSLNLHLRLKYTCAPCNLSSDWWKSHRPPASQQPPQITSPHPTVLSVCSTMSLVPSQFRVVAKPPPSTTTTAANNKQDAHRLMCCVMIDQLVGDQCLLDQSLLDSSLYKFSGYLLCDVLHTGFKLYTVSREAGCCV